MFYQVPDTRLKDSALLCIQEYDSEIHIFVHPRIFFSYWNTHCVQQRGGASNIGVIKINDHTAGRTLQLYGKK